MPHLILPAITLAAYPMSLVARMTPALDAGGAEQDYIRTARAYGGGEHRHRSLRAQKRYRTDADRHRSHHRLCPDRRVLFRGDVFNWPGLGLFTSLLKVDYPAIMGMTLFGAVGYVLLNLVVDLSQAWIDPASVCDEPCVK